MSSKSVPVIKPLLYVLIIGGIIWGLVALFQPPEDLVPYNKYKKTDVSVAAPDETSPEKPIQTSFVNPGTGPGTCRTAGQK